MNFDRPAANKNMFTGNQVHDNLTARKVAKEVVELLAPHIELILTGVLRTCVTCDNFDKKNELCKLCMLRPPAEVIATGCPQYEEQIPF